MRVKGLHDVATSQNVRAHHQADTRAQQLAELARLEREKDRLAREAELWAANLQRTTQHLQEVERRQQGLFQLLEASLAAPLEDPARGAGAPNVASGSASRPPKAGTGKRWQTVPLEY